MSRERDEETGVGSAKVTAAASGAEWLTVRNRRWLGLAIVMGLLATAIWSYTHQGILHALVGPGLTGEQRILAVQAYFQSWGWFAPVVYIAVVVLEVTVAPLPGLMLYAPGGIIFGGFFGGLFSLIGNVLGAGLSCQLIRLLGRDRLQRFLEKDRIQDYDQKLSRAGVWVVFALRVNPLTSSDLVSYAAGLTSMPIWKVMVGTLFGMAPLCWGQAYLADSVLRAWPWLIYPLIGLCLVYVVLVIWLVPRLLSQRRP